jgi:hypothetical protein
MNSTLASDSSTSHWITTFKREGYFFRQVGIFVIAFGAYLHLTRLFVGDAILTQYVLTPTLDKLFAIPMAYAALTGILSWMNMLFISRIHKAFVTFIVFYMTVSVPLHAATYFTNSTEFFTSSFPIWVSFVLLPYFTLIIVTLFRFRYKETV